MTAFFFVSTSLCCPFFGTVKVYRFCPLGDPEKVSGGCFLGHFENIDPTRSKAVYCIGIIVKL